jgi:hypothetical protein
MEVFARDGFECLARRYDSDHACGNMWGEDVAPGNVEYVNALTLEHVRMEPGGRRWDDKRACVTLCHRANAEQHWGSSFGHRSLLNEYLDGLYPARRAELWA